MEKDGKIEIARVTAWLREHGRYLHNCSNDGYGNILDMFEDAAGALERGDMTHPEHLIR